MVMRTLHDALVSLSRVERRLEPFFRAPLDAVLREPQAALIQALINLGRRREEMALAEERQIPDEEAHIQSIIDTMRDQMIGYYSPGQFERGGNSKTHGLVRGEVTIRDDVPEHMRRGIFAQPRRFPAWVRFSGPGPNVPADIDDVGFGSMAIKLMDVPGSKLMDDEKHTQDLICVCTPTFVTPDCRANARLQYWSLRRTPLWYFLDPRETHLLDFWMQALWNKTMSNPLGERYYSCVPYLLGEGQAMQYAFYSRTAVPRHIPNLPFGRPPFNYLRDNMAATLREKDVEFDILAQVQTDAFRMPIENAAVLWPESLSPRIPVATLHIPRQTFHSPAQFEFAKVLSYNPWHCLPEHRPLGNQSRTRLRLYSELSRFRQAMNHVAHLEPTGNEVFD
jgi:hypothetical protein